MIAPAKPVRRRPIAAAWNAFLTMFPVIARHARIAFRNRRGDDRDDLIQEVIANAAVAFLRLVELGKAELAYPLSSHATESPKSLRVAALVIGSTSATCSPSTRSVRRTSRLTGSTASTTKQVSGRRFWSKIAAPHRPMWPLAGSTSATGCETCPRSSGRWLPRLATGETPPGPQPRSSGAAGADFPASEGIAPVVAVLPGGSGTAGGRGAARVAAWADLKAHFPKSFRHNTISGLHGRSPVGRLPSSPSIPAASPALRPTEGPWRLCRFRPARRSGAGFRAQKSPYGLSEQLVSGRFQGFSLYRSTPMNGFTTLSLIALIVVCSDHHPRKPPPPGSPTMRSAVWSGRSIATRVKDRTRGGKG